MTLPEGVSGTLLAYATAPGAASLEREGERNSIYTKHLLNALRDMPSLSLTDLLIDVRKAVKEDTGGEQVPWEAISLTERFAFAEGEPTPAPKQPTPRPSQEGNTELPSSEGQGVGSCWENETQGAECRKETTGMEFVYVPGDCFQMGSNNGDPDEKPVHKVCLKGFWKGKFEVTQAQWETIMKNNPSYFTGADRPVERVSWNDTQAFLKELNAAVETHGRASLQFRLPSEAEWEYAARAGTQTAYSFGDDPNQLGEYAWFHDNSGSEIHPVGQKKPNGFGLYDMHGNVWEWCLDAYASYSDTPTDGSAYGSLGDKKANRLLRGGSWDSVPDLVRSANRPGLAPDGRNGGIGFRLVFSRTQYPLALFSFPCILFFFTLFSPA